MVDSRIINCGECYFSETDDDTCFCNYFEEDVDPNEYCRFYVQTDVLYSVLITFLDNIFGNYDKYRHLPLEKKLDVLDKLDFKQISVCDDVQEHYDYFQNNFNHNPKDCCNLRM